MSKLVPNSFQHPNIYVDVLSCLLTPEEEKVLNKAIREILGWHNKVESRKSAISLSVFMDGKFCKETGKRLCYGCGLSINTVRSALKTLNDTNILVKIGNPTPDGQMYWLQDDDTKIDWNWLENRYNNKKKNNTKRVEAATLVSAAKRAALSSDDTGDTLSSDDTPKKAALSSDDTVALSSHDRAPAISLSSHDNKETHVKKHSMKPKDHPVNVSGMKVVDLLGANLDLSVEEWKHQLELELESKSRKKAIEYMEKRVEGISHDEAIGITNLSGDLFVAVAKVCGYDTRFLNGKMSKQCKLVVEMFEKRMSVTNKTIKPEHVSGFLSYYNEHDWRGIKGSKLEPNLICELWDDYARWVQAGMPPSNQNNNGKKRSNVDVWVDRNAKRQKGVVEADDWK